MGLRDRLRQLKDEWNDTPVPDWPKDKPPRDHGTCCQRGCTDPAIGPNRLCTTHATTT